ncbi:MAG: hypothetical protein ACLQVL_24405 [Terriglobia bacterium]
MHGRVAAAPEGVIHTAFIHGFSEFEVNCKIDRRAVKALGSTFVGSDRLLIVTSGTGAAITPGRLTTEEDAPNSPIPRVASEQAAASVGAQGVRVLVDWYQTMRINHPQKAVAAATALQSAGRRLKRHLAPSS